MRVDLSPEAANKYDDAAITVRINEAVAIASVYAPCMKSDNFTHEDAAKAIIRGAVVYDLNTAASTNNDPSTQTQTAGPFQATKFTPVRSGTLFSPTQIQALKELCPKVALRKSYSVKLDPPTSVNISRLIDPLWE